MTINLQTLKCAECGGGALKRTGINQYVCEHCGSVAVVEDNVSERLDRMLDQVKDAAAGRLADEQRARSRQTSKTLVIVALAVGVIAAAASALSVFLSSRQQAAQRASNASRPVVAAAVDRTIPVDGLKLEGVRQVLVGSGSSARPKLLVMVRNETGHSLDRPAVKASLYDGDNRLGERSESVPIGVLAAGETAPLLIDLPSDKNVTRHELQVQRLAAPYRSAEGPKLAFTRVRLVQQKDDLRLVGRIVNTRTDATLAGVEALVVLYDDGGVVIGFGRGYAHANEIRPGERSSMDVRIERFGNGQGAIAAWDYRLNYTIESPGQSGRTQVLSAARVVRTAGGPESFNPELRMSSDDLLAEDAERFDLNQLELLPLVPGRGVTQRPLYLTELVNRSTDRIAITPGAVISHFDGSRLDGTSTLGAVASLYPGERLPVLLEPRGSGRITQTRIEWKPMRGAALPGARAPLDVTVTDTRADTSSVLVNFSARYTYKFAMVSGSVNNSGKAIVRKVRLWVSLRDREGKLTGFSMVENLPAIAPGESVPFEVKVDQKGRDFASVSTLYQTE